ncbi:hypothetical protein FSP39_010128 [Pinctada imbricata]|uniref:B box-type domain-containing protein n=1 Tax=Pinctada imbricata TaxID=66713 RepID=A0AA88XFN6_PINIB|nr:hypothetical protein FSP39_010128 [Pinctada imbricata]
MATANQGPLLHQTYVECDGCEDDNEVEWYCISCKSNLCGSCKTARLHRKHILKPWKDPESVSARQDAPMPCKVHPDKTYVNYCTDCDVLCCSACNAGDHSGHHFKTIEDVVDEKRTALRNFVDELKDNCTSKAKEMKDKLAGNKEKFISRCSMNKEKIKQKIDSLRKDLTSMEDQLMKEEESIKNENVSKLEKDILEVKNTEDKIAETIKNIEKELSVSSNQSIIQRSLSSLSLENYKVRNISLLPTQEFETSDYKFPSTTETIGLRRTRFETFCCFQE